MYGPLLKPPLAAVAILTFVNTWNDYLWPSVTISNTLVYVPITLRIEALLGGEFIRAGGNPAALPILVTLLPPALVFIWLQRYFYQGLLSMSPKG